MEKTIKVMNKPYTLGADEVGYGSLAGPVVVCAVRVARDWTLTGLNDSKKLTDKQRRTMDNRLRICAELGEVQFIIHQEDAWKIDEHGISKSLRTCYLQAATPLYQEDTTLIIDGNINYFDGNPTLECKPIIKADTFIPAVMAASILAKVYRDNIMIKMAAHYPEYDFDGNKGYGSEGHIAAIKKYGRSAYHRESYKLKQLGEK